MSFEVNQQTGQQQEAVEQQLDLFRDALAQRAYPGYPEFANRLVLHPTDLDQTTDGRLILPDGPWNVDSHAKWSDTQTAPTPAQRMALLEQGHVLDSRGRPLHPWLLKMIADPLIGVVLGKGAYWEWADNRTADAVVVKNDHALLVKRRDTGEWALPGGHGETDETAVQTAVREVAEETGFTIPSTAQAIPTYEGPVADIRATAHAWPETSAFLFRLDDDGPLPEVHGADDVEAAAWVPLAALQSGEVPLFGSHRYLVATALAELLKIPQELDLLTTEWTELFAAAPLYQKRGIVRIRPAVPGERIRTVLADGTDETENIAGENQVVVTNPGGEEHIIDTDKADKRYEATEVEGVFRAKGKIRALGNPTGRAIEITAPWGEKQYGGPDCKIAALYSAEEPDVVSDDRYIIGASAFAQTYGSVDETLE